MIRMTSKSTAICKSIWLGIFKLVAPMIYISYQPRSPYVLVETVHDLSPLIRIYSSTNKDPLYLSITDGVEHLDLQQMNRQIYFHILSYHKSNRNIYIRHISTSLDR